MLDIFVARQPIFDRERRLAGYELLYRSSAENNWAAGATPNRMVSDTVVHSVIGIGLNRIADGKPVFLNLTRDHLLDGLYDLFEPGTAVIELLETVECDEQTLAACERLVRMGHPLALDDFVYSPAFEPLLKLADIVKVDVLNRAPEELAEVVARLRPFDVRLLAERVETAEVRDACERLGFELFQGYYFSKPEILSRRTTSVEQGSTVRLMNMLRDPGATDIQIEMAFSSDPSLAYKLLRIVNSVPFGGRGVESIPFALRLMGREPLARWLALLFVSSLATEAGTDAELVRMALLRGRLCELIADERRQAGGGAPLFMVGLFSNLDALLRTPMEDVVDRIGLAAPVRDALLERRGPYAAALELAELYERGAWEPMSAAAARLGLTAERVGELYRESLGWTRERLQSIGVV